MIENFSFIKCLKGRLIIPRAMRVDKIALALGGISIKESPSRKIEVD